MLNPENATGESINIERLADLLKMVKQNNGILYYSVEDTTDPLNILAEEIIQIIESYHCQQKLVDPHPRAYGYDRSFIPHLNEALEAALIDVQGLERDYRNIEELLERLGSKHPEYSHKVREKRSIVTRLTEAQTALKKILLLHFDLCVEPDGLEQ